MSGINQLNTELTLIKQNIKTRIKPLISNNNMSDIDSIIKIDNNIPIVSLENVFDVMTDTTKEEKTIPLIQWIIKNKFSEYFTYRLNKKRPNNIYLKYHRVNNFENFENIRNYFLKMKELSLGVQKFKEEWVERSNKLFNLCENEAIEILTLLTESISKKQDLKIREYQNYDIDIIIKKKSEFEYTVIIDNATSFSELNNIKLLIQTLFSYDKKPQARVLVSVAKDEKTYNR